MSAGGVTRQLGGDTCGWCDRACGPVEGSGQGCMAGWPRVSCGVSLGADWKTSVSAKTK